MEVYELFYPEKSVSIGQYLFQKGIELEVYSSKSSYFDWAKVKFTSQFQEKIGLSKKDPAQISLGYDGVWDKVFGGYVNSDYSEISQNEIILKDAMILLEETMITHTFMDATPQEILTYCLNKAGITHMVISNKVYPRKKIVPVYQKNVLDVIREIHSLWKINESFFFAEDIFYWGEKPKQSKIYEFNYGINILSLQRSGGMWELETVSTPFIHHSQKIRITHPKITGEFEVQKAVFLTNEAGFIRTYLYF